MFSSGNHVREATERFAYSDSIMTDIFRASIAVTMNIALNCKNPAKIVTDGLGSALWESLIFSICDTAIVLSC